MNFAVGSLVKARGREWVVLPESEGEILVLRPLGGTNDEVTGIYLPLETVEPAQFKPPDPTQWGDAHSCRLLRDAVRIGFRSSTGPFRSFAHLAFEPRPYQLVPLLMALRLDPVRLLIADDVGIGKTIEARLIASELLARREVSRLAVLCPPHLAEQWQDELRDKFHIEATLLLSSTAVQLERACQRDQSVFELHPYMIISTDFIKTDSRREKFLLACPELVIVDEAHTCAYAGEGRGIRHQRYQLIASLAADLQRHLILVTATPHSGNEEAFRSLLSFLDADFKNLPLETGRHNERQRQRLAAHFVQRRRGDIRSYLHRETPFPEREDVEESYAPSREYRQLIEKVLSYARETVRDTRGGQSRQRVRWWSVLGLLRCIASSPAAAAYTLRNRAQVVGAETLEEADSIGRHTILDLVDGDALESDVSPGSDLDDEDEPQERAIRRQRLLAMARDADALCEAGDSKLQKATELIGRMVKDGYQPIVFCRFIPTAEYVAKALRAALPKSVEVAFITGLQPPDERENRVLNLAQFPQRVLVCTDCLSEGINLQAYFNAVFHYDLSWNPTRPSRCSWRVDRFGQLAPRVKVVTYYGRSNQIDHIVLDVLIRKHRAIRKDLGISVPVPLNTEEVVEALFKSVLTPQTEQLALPGLDEPSADEVSAYGTGYASKRDELYRQWDASKEREKQSRSIFAHYGIKVDEVEQELNAVRAAMGLTEEVEAFTKEALRALGAFINDSSKAAGVIDFNLADVPQAALDAIDAHNYMNAKKHLRASFTREGLPNTETLNRTHPFVEGLAAYVMDTALDPIEHVPEQPIARRCGVISTGHITVHTTLLLVRLRFHIHTAQHARPLLAEDCRIFAFRGAPQRAEWFDDEQQIEAVLHAPSEANLPQERITFFLRRVLDNLPEHIQPRLAQFAQAQADQLYQAHRRVRKTASLGVRYVNVEPQLPPDVLGIYVYLPHTPGAS